VDNYDESERKALRIVQAVVSNDSPLTSELLALCIVGVNLIATIDDDDALMAWIETRREAAKAEGLARLAARRAEVDDAKLFDWDAK
jgi:hypothetical protein